MSGGRPLPVGCIALLAVLLLVALVWKSFRDVGIGQLVRSIPDYLIALGALASLTVLAGTGHTVPSERVNDNRNANYGCRT